MAVFLLFVCQACSQLFSHNLHNGTAEQMSDHPSLHCGSKIQKAEGMDANPDLIFFLHYIPAISDIDLSSGTKGISWGSQKAKKNRTHFVIALGLSH